MTIPSPTPALVTQRAATPMRRSALWLLCAAYLLPGLIGRDPWKAVDVRAFGVMTAMAEGRIGWLQPSLGGVPVDAALPPHWLGAAFIALLGPLFGAPMAARIPFALLLALSFALTWYAAFHLARTDAAQPVPLAFGGEAATLDYARAIADGALLAMVATLGLLQFGHETTPELAQLACVAALLWALAATPYHPLRSRAVALAALPLLAACGAPATACVLALAAAAVCALSGYASARSLAPWLAAAGVAAALLAQALGTWAWRVNPPSADVATWARIGRLLLWFLWPSWLLALWTVWRWRHHLQYRHIAAPLAVALTGLGVSLAMGGADRALLLALPGLAVLAAFALPTLKRSAGAAIDWFSVFFFSAGAIAIWVVYLSLVVGVPAKPAANVARLAPGFAMSFSPLALATALAASIAWIALVRWRTGRQRHPLWKSLVLPAGGVALCWALALSLWLAPLDYARSYRPMIDRIARHVPDGSCVASEGFDDSAVAAFEYFRRWRVDATPGAAGRGCAYLLVAEPRGARTPARSGWRLVARTGRPTDREEGVAIFRRAP